MPSPPDTDLSGDLHPCLFCGHFGPYITKNHLLPHSLGGVSNMILPPGLTCDKCNHYFGSQVESEALKEFPLNLVRLFYSIPTKKRDCIKIRTVQGVLKPTGSSRYLGLDPDLISAQEDALDSGHLLLNGEPSHGVQGLKSRRCLCRLLLKMGVEMIATEHGDRARSAEFAAARETARAPRTGRQWIYHIAISPRWLDELQLGLTFDDYLDSCELSIRESEWGSAFAYEARGFTLMVPLFEHSPAPDASVWGPWDFYVPVTF